MIPTLALLMALATGPFATSPHEIAVRHVAGAMGVDADYAACIVQHESAWDPSAVGDQGRALGLWQWHEPSWQHVRAKMGLSTEDRRTDPVASTSAALYWIRRGHADWWTASRKCSVISGQYSVGSCPLKTDYALYPTPQLTTHSKGVPQ
jgi:hypothetical protein